MKKIGEYTCKGQGVINTTERIVLFDGRFDTAYRVTKFVVTPANPYGNYDAFGLLSVNDESAGTGNEWDWDTNDQIAWSAWGASATGAADTSHSFVDPDNLVVEDLFIHFGVGTDNQDVNYMIHLEKYSISDWQGALAMVRNRSQS